MGITGRIRRVSLRWLLLLATVAVCAWLSSLAMAASAGGQVKVRVTVAEAVGVSLPGRTAQPVLNTGARQVRITLADGILHPDPSVRVLVTVYQL